MKLCPIGTSRLHRPLQKRVEGHRIHVNSVPGVEVVYPRMGYFHAPEEAAQLLRILAGHLIVPPDLLKLIFRLEFRPTTPGNEFREDLEAAARASTPIDLRSEWFNDIDVFVVEASTLTLHMCRGLFVQLNPNLYKEVDYTQLWPEGFYAKFAPELGATEVASDPRAAFMQIQQTIGGRPLIVFGHLNDPARPSGTRVTLNNKIRAAAEAAGATYLDPEPFVAEFGFRFVDGKEDTHHLSHEGEMAFGQALQKLALRVGTLDDVEREHQRFG